LGIHTPPRTESAVAPGSRSATSAGKSSAASTPSAATRLTARRRSSQLSSLAAIRTLPTSSKTPSSRYSATLYRRKRSMVEDGLNCVTSPAAWCVEPLVSSPLSSRRTSSQPALARWYATLQPAMPPPTTTTSARSTRQAPAVIAPSRSMPSRTVSTTGQRATLTALAPRWYVRWARPML
jgi:hypothetical protein